MMCSKWPLLSFSRPSLSLFYTSASNYSDEDKMMMMAVDSALRTVDKARL